MTVAAGCASLSGSGRRGSVRETRWPARLAGLALLAAVLLGALLADLGPTVRSQDRGVPALGADLPQFSPGGVSI